MTQDLAKSTEQNILDAARQHFHQKGLAGARMQEIANQAGINKAMLHYYHKSKHQLFEAVLYEDFKTLLPSIIHILSSDTPLFDKIRHFADQYISTIQHHPYLPGFVINELSQNPDQLVKLVTGHEAFQPEVFFNQVREAVKDGKIQETDPHHLLVNTVSMCLFPFIGKPMLKAILQNDEEDFQRFLEARKQAIPEFIISSIKKPS